MAEDRTQTPPANGNSDPEADGRGLLLVELLALPKRISWRRYREDIGGFLLAWAFVGALMLLLVGIARAEEIPNTDARLKTRGVWTDVQPKSYAAREEWEARARTLRQQILMAGGLWPMPERTPLNVHIFGRVDREGYSIEKAYFESYPGFYCTGNLYRPRGRTGPFPGVWSPHGHWAYGRLENSEMGSVVARAINLARQGYVVFSPDMVGYNDSQQVNHQFGGPRQELWGITVLGLQLWNSIRGLDFLESLPDVDRSRLLMTGASGGGTQTFLATAVDDRVKVSVPVNMISAHMQGGSNCENAPNLRVDTDNIEIGALAAPRPLLMVAATGDWTKDNPKLEYPAIRAIYRLFGAEEHVANQQFNYDHNYNRDSRDAMYAWFARWALGDSRGEQHRERSYRAEFPPEMLVFYGRERPKGVTEDELVRWRIADAERQLTALKPSDRTRLERFREVMGPALRLSVMAQMPDAVTLLVKELGSSKYLLGRSGRGDRLPAAIWQPKRPVRRPPAVLLVHPDGAAAAGASPIAAELLRRGYVVASIDAFQTGSARGERVQTNDRPDRFFTTYNRTDASERVQDILTAIAWLRSRSEYSSVDLAGLDAAGPLVLLARALAPAEAVRRTVADAAGFDSESDDAYVKLLPIPLIRRAGDFRTATTLIAPAPLLVHNTGGRFRTEWAQNAFRVAGAEASLAVKDASVTAAEIAAWLR